MNLWSMFPLYMFFNPGDDVEKLARTCNTPNKIANWVFHHIKYETDVAQYDETEYWASPEEILASRKGDCEDIAGLYATVLKLQGVTEVYVIAAFLKDSGHAICAYRDKDTGQLNYVDRLNGIHYTDKKEYRDIAHMIYRSYISWETYDETGKLLAREEISE